MTAVLRSGWLTTGAECRAFEAELRRRRRRHATPSPSTRAPPRCTSRSRPSASQRGDVVLVPTLTFAATAEVVRYFGARPLLVDCEPRHAQPRRGARRGCSPSSTPGGGARPVGPGPRARHHARALRRADGRRRRRGRRSPPPTACAWSRTRRTPCPPPPAARTAAGAAAAPPPTSPAFRFYANKTHHHRRRRHGSSPTTPRWPSACGHVAARHFAATPGSATPPKAAGTIEIIAPGFKYNLTDIAAALGRCTSCAAPTHAVQSAAARSPRATPAPRRRRGAGAAAGAPTDRRTRGTSIPCACARTRLASAATSFIDELGRAGIGTSVHWMPLHLHPYYRETYGSGPSDLHGGHAPSASAC